MFEINKDNIAEVCQKLNDMEYDDATDKEICDWFIKLKHDFCEEFNKFFDEDYDYDEICFEYFGCVDDYNEVKDIVDVFIEGNKLKISNSHVFQNSSIGPVDITNVIKIPLDFAFDREMFIENWKRKVSENHIKTLQKEIEECYKKISEAQEKMILEKNKITLAN